MNASKSTEKFKFPLSFTGKSSSGDLTEALKDALKQAAESLHTTNVPWKIERTGGDRLALGPITVTIELTPPTADRGGTGPK